MSRIKQWLGSDSIFEDAETNGNDWRQIEAAQQAAQQAAQEQEKGFSAPEKD